MEKLEQAADHARAQETGRRDFIGAILPESRGQCAVNQERGNWPPVTLPGNREPGPGKGSDFPETVNRRCDFLVNLADPQ